MCFGGVVRADASQLCGGAIGAEEAGKSAFDEVPQLGVEPAHALGAACGEVVVALGEQAQHDAVVFGADGADATVESDDRDRACVVSVVLVRADVVERPHA